MLYTLVGCTLVLMGLKLRNTVHAKLDLIENTVLGIADIISVVPGADHKHTVDTVATADDTAAVDNPATAEEGICV